MPSDEPSEQSKTRVTFNVRRPTDLVESLSSKEWAADSDCEGWTIGEVAAHCTLGDGIPWSVARSVIGQVGLAAGIERMQRQWAAEGISFVAERLRSDKVSIYLRWGFGQWRVLSLIELVIHSEDIRRPLGRQRHRPLDPVLATTLLGPMGRRVTTGRKPGSRITRHHRHLSQKTGAVGY